MQAGSDWLYIYPRGIQDILEYTNEKYNNPIIYITENGMFIYHKFPKSLFPKELNLYHVTIEVCFLSINHVFQIFAGVDEVNDGTKSLDDKLRIYYIGQHLLYVLRAIR